MGAWTQCFSPGFWHLPLGPRKALSRVVHHELVDQGRWYVMTASSGLGVVVISEV